MDIAFLAFPLEIASGPHECDALIHDPFADVEVFVDGGADVRGFYFLGFESARGKGGLVVGVCGGEKMGYGERVIWDSEGGGGGGYCICSKEASYPSGGVLHTLIPLIV